MDKVLAMVGFEQVRKDGPARTGTDLSYVALLVYLDADDCLDEALGFFQAGATRISLQTGAGSMGWTVYE